MITIVVNNKRQEFSQDISVEHLLSELKMKAQGIAVAVNNRVILKTAWETKFLHDHDKVTIIQATQGG